MIAKTMAEVLAEHIYKPAEAVCSCSDFVQVGLKCDAKTHPQHVAEALSAAGFGLVADTKAERASAMQEAMRIAWEQGRNAVWAFMSNTDPRRERPTNPYRNPS